VNYIRIFFETKNGFALFKKNNRIEVKIFDSQFVKIGLKDSNAQNSICYSWKFKGINSKKEHGLLRKKHESDAFP
jgi:hypothetical protein